MDWLSRREIIRTFVLGTAFSNVIGQAWAASLRFDVRPMAKVQSGLLKVKLADFPELNNSGGSVRVGTSPVVRNSPDEIRASGLLQPVLINRGAGGLFYVMMAECTHAGCSVNRLSGGIMQCPCHGSQYTIDGSVVRGPAAQPLQRLEFREQNGSLEIVLPDVPFELVTDRIASSSRFHINFLAFTNMTYQVYFRPSLTAPLQKVNFSTTPNGPLTQIELPGVDNFVDLYLDRSGTAGFFHVAIKSMAV